MPFKLVSMSFRNFQISLLTPLGSSALVSSYAATTMSPLVTTVGNAAQSRQLELKVYTCLVDGSEAQLLFANKGDLYDGKGFEMDDAISNHFSPCDDMVTFEILHDLPNNRQGVSGPVTSHQSRLEGMFLHTSSSGQLVSSKLQAHLTVTREGKSSLPSAQPAAVQPAVTDPSPPHSSPASQLNEGGLVHSQ
eukprot:scaffold1836_cov204-Alexandrium_tamarense.AAC.47